MWLDGDRVREGLSQDLGYTLNDRIKPPANFRSGQHRLRTGVASSCLSDRAHGSHPSKSQESARSCENRALRIKNLEVASGQ